jgi:uncharacterized membrane protein
MREELIEELARPVRRRLHGKNIPDSERAISVMAGAALAAIGLRRRGVLGGILAGVGAALIARGVGGRSAVYRGVAMRGGVEVRRSIIVQRTRREVYRALRALRYTPRFMSHLVSVEETGVTSRWIAKVGPIQLAWHAQIVEDLPDLRLSWRSRPGGDVDHEGAIDLEDAPGDRGTLVTISLRFQPPARRLITPWKSLLRIISSNQLATDLIRMRQLLETGEIATGVRRVDDLGGAERRAVVPRATNGHTRRLPPFTVPRKVGA